MMQVGAGGSLSRPSADIDRAAELLALNELLPRLSLLVIFLNRPKCKLFEGLLIHRDSFSGTQIEHYLLVAKPPPPSLEIDFIAFPPRDFPTSITAPNYNADSLSVFPIQSGVPWRAGKPIFTKLIDE
jgi:hypothetical protein